MSLITATEALASILLDVDPSPEDGPRIGCIYQHPREAVNIAEFPSIVITLAPGVSHEWVEEALGLMRHNYSLTLYVFLGIRQTPLPELSSRAQPWPEALARVLSANLTLGGVVNQIGFGGDPRLFTYKLGPIPWGTTDNDQYLYWGITVTLPIVEKIGMEMGA